MATGITPAGANGGIFGGLLRWIGGGSQGGGLVSDDFTPQEKERRRAEARRKADAARAAAAAQPQTPATTAPQQTASRVLTAQEKADYVFNGANNADIANRQFGEMQRTIDANRARFQQSLANERQRIMNEFRSEPDPMIRTLLAQQVRDLDARLQAAVPSIGQAYQPAIDSARQAATAAAATGQEYGRQLRDSYFGAAQAETARSDEATAALAAALGNQVAAGNTSSASRDFGQFMQAMAPIQQTAANNYGEMLAAILNTDANSSIRQQGADQAAARNLTQQLVAQAQQEAAIREMEQVQRARELRAQALSDLAARELQGQMSFDEQLARAMETRNQSEFSTASERAMLEQGFRLEELNGGGGAGLVAYPAELDALIPRTGNPIVLGMDSDGRPLAISQQTIRSAVERAYEAAMLVAPFRRWNTYINALRDGTGIPEQALAQADQFGYNVFGRL